MFYLSTLDSDLTRNVAISVSRSRFRTSSLTDLTLRGLEQTSSRIDRPSWIQAKPPVSSEFARSSQRISAVKADCSLSSLSHTRRSPFLANMSPSAKDFVTGIGESSSNNGSFGCSWPGCERRDKEGNPKKPFLTVQKVSIPSAGAFFYPTS